jgi:ABC-type glycerol-3-phosphate transport system substrate-binding protein
MKRKRAICVFAALFCMILIGSCGGEQQNAKAAPKNQSGLDPIEFTVFSPWAEQRIPPDSAEIVQQLYQATGVHLRWILPPAEALERLNIMLATDDLPDSIYFDNPTMMQQFIDAGKLLDLEDLMKANAPQAYNLNFASFRDRIRNSKDDKMYFLPAWYDFGDAADSLFFPETDIGFSVRTGLLEELGWYDPKDLDSVYKLLQICKERYPDMAPMALALGPQGYLDQMNLVGAGVFGLTYEWSNIILDGGEIKYFSDVPQMKEWYAYLNKIHRAGLLDVESPVMSIQMLKEKAVAGKIFSWFGSGWEAGSEFIAYMESIGSDEQVFWYFHPRANDSVKKTTFATFTRGLYTTGLTLTKKNRDPARFLKFYEYLNTEEGWLASSGIVNFDFTGENTVENTVGYDFVVLNDQPEIRPGMKRLVVSEWMGHSWNDDENWWWNRGLESFGTFHYGEGNHPLGKYDYVGDRDVGMWWDDNTKRVNAAYGITGLNYFEVMNDTGSDITLISGLVLEPDSDETVIQLTMEEYLKTQLPRIIVADTAQQFESLWQDMNRRLSSDGKDKFVAKKNALYKERLEDWGLE